MPRLESAARLSDRYAWLLLCVLAFSLWYAPWLSQRTAVVRIFDNLDSEVVTNYIIGAFIRGDPHASTLALNGHLPIWVLSRLCQPFTLLYAIIADPWTAYALEDLLVRIVAYCGALVLARRFGVGGIAAFLGACCFAASIVYSVDALSVAGLPLAVWLLDRESSSRWVGVARIAGLVLIGLNSSLVLSGIFFLVTAPPLLRFGFGTPLRMHFWAGLFSYGIGLALGNANIIYAQLFSDIIWHRVEFGNFTNMTISNLQAIKIAAWSVLTQNPWYHVGPPLRWLVGSALISLVLQPSKKRQVAVFFVFLALMSVIWIANQTPLAGTTRLDSWSFLREFLFDRFYFLASLLSICVWFAAFRSSTGAMRTILLVAVICQSALLVATSDHWHKVLRGKTFGSVSFERYYQHDWFKQVRTVVGDAPIVSVSMDPMIAPMNGVAAIGGYYSMYPLEYKHQFKAIIDKSLGPAGHTKDFDGWGSQLYTFHPRGHAELLDFCAAFRLGARYVLAGEEIESEYLTTVLRDEHRNVRAVYRIRGEMCQRG